VAETQPLGAHYFILLILTDGVVTDVQETYEAIVAVCTQQYVYCGNWQATK
jgi:hypothetical protein